MTPAPSSGLPSKLVVIIPYRDRAENLAKLVAALDRHLAPLPHHIAVIEQAGRGVFNKGRLLNAGFDLHRDHDAYFCFHDVDLLPESPACDYSYPTRPTHLSAYCSQFDYALPYEEIFGGVVLFARHDFLRANGYSNEYWGWGCEDDDMARRLAFFRIGFARRMGKYLSLPHAQGWRQDLLPGSYKRNRERLSGNYSYLRDGLTSLKYKVVGVSRDAGVSHYLIDVGTPAMQTPFAMREGTPQSRPLRIPRAIGFRGCS